jgi:TonB family protein
VQALLAEGVDLNARSERGQTALILAAFFGWEEIVSVLLAGGADLSLKDNLGLTALEWSERRGFARIARLIGDTTIPQFGSMTRTAENLEEDADVQFKNLGAVSTIESPPATGKVIASQPHSDRLATTEKPRTSLLAVLRARAVQSMREESEAETWRPERTTPAKAPAASLSAETDQQPPLRNEAAAAETAEVQFVPEPLLEEPGDFSEEEITSTSQLPGLTVDASSAENQSPIPSSIQPVSVAARATVPPVDETPQPIIHETARMRTGASTLFNPPPTAASARPLLWVVIVVTFCAAAFVTYRLTSHSAATAPVSSAPAVVTKTEPTKAVPPKRLPVVGGELAGAELSVPEPENADGTSGSITVRVQVNRKGKVVGTHILNGEWALRKAATQAARAATFAPEKLNSKSRVVTGTITYEFAALQSEPAPVASPAPAQSPTTTTSSVNANEDLPVTGDDLAGAELNLPNAEYPASARALGISGTITVIVRVNRLGRVISWRTSSGDTKLRAAALQAAKKSTFAPSKLPGKGEVVGTITYTFKL